MFFFNFRYEGRLKGRGKPWENMRVSTVSDKVTIEAAGKLKKS